MSVLLLAWMMQIAVPMVGQPAAYRGNLTMEIELQPPATSATTAANGDLVVTSRRPLRAKLSTRTDRATRTRQCTLRRGFGLPPIDPSLCGNLLECMIRNSTRASVKACMTNRLTTDLKRVYGSGAS